MPRWAITIGAISSLLAGLVLLVASCPTRADPRATQRVSGVRPIWADPLPKPPEGTSLVRAEDFVAGVRIRVRDDSGLSSREQPLFIAHSRNGWQPDQDRMTLSEDDEWEVVIPHDPQGEPLEFKFTLGSWERCEVDSGGFSVPNRTLPFIDARKHNAGATVNVELSVARFLREGETENSGRGWVPRVSSGRIEVLTVRGGGGRAKDLVRDVWVWLPAGYDEPANRERSYPVLVMLDGQAMFERPPGFEGSWDLDTTAQRLIARGLIEPFVCIAVPHSGSFRFDEYLAFPIDAEDIDSQYMYAEALGTSRPSGEEFARFLKDVVLPAARERFRIAHEPSRVALGGGDLAASFAYYAASRHPDAFGKAMCESPLLPQSRQGRMRYMAQLTSGHPAPRTLYYGFGDLIVVEERVLGVVDTESVVNEIEVGRSLVGLASQGPLAMHVNFKRGTGAGITWWAQRLPEALQAMFPASGLPMTAPSAVVQPDTAPPAPGSSGP